MVSNTDKKLVVALFLFVVVGAAAVDVVVLLLLVLLVVFSTLLCFVARTVVVSPRLLLYRRFGFFSTHQLTCAVDVDSFTSFLLPDKTGVQVAPYISVQPLC